jgi:hypothetical protein
MKLGDAFGLSPALFEFVSPVNFAFFHLPVLVSGGICEGNFGKLSSRKSEIAQKNY